MAAPPIVDAHNDLLQELAYRSGEERPFATHWLPHLEAGGVALQVCPMFGADLEVLPELALRRALQQASAFWRAVRENEDRVAAVLTAADLETVERGDRIGLLLSLESAEPLGYDVDLVDALWALGVRMASLTWNRRNPFADGAAEAADGGLSRLGRELVARLAERGMIIDLAHASERTFWDVLEHSGDAPVVVSHADCRAIVDTPRNVSDDQLRALRDRGGVLGVMQLAFTVDPERWQIDRVVDHVDHAVEVMGVEHVGLGGDFFAQVMRAVPMRIPADALRSGGVGFDTPIEGLAGPEDYPNLVAALRARGYEGERLAAILGGNLLRLFRRALPA